VHDKRWRDEDDFIFEVLRGKNMPNEMPKIPECDRVPAVDPLSLQRPEAVASALRQLEEWREQVTAELTAWRSVAHDFGDARTPTAFREFLAEERKTYREIKTAFLAWRENVATLQVDQRSADDRG
jgi:hypothetical protein